jgi:hypothetical protein
MHFIHSKAKAIVIFALVLTSVASIYSSAIVWSRSSEAFTEFFVADDQNAKELTTESFPSDPKLREGGAILGEASLEGTPYDDCIIFGNLYYYINYPIVRVPLGPGICIFRRNEGVCDYDSDMGIDYDEDVEDVYKVYAGSGDDEVRFATTTHLYCGIYNGYAHYIDSFIEDTYDGKA